MAEEQWQNSKALYMMNGGNKLYIYKDGFGDIYSATPEEEATWAKEIIANELKKIDTEENTTGLKFAIENLRFHHYSGLEDLLISKLENTSNARQIVFAGSLWKLFRYEKSFAIIYQHYLQGRATCINDVFWGLTDFKNNIEAAEFLIECLQVPDELLSSRAYTTISMWAYTGLPELRQGKLLERLGPENRSAKTFKTAVEELKKYFQMVLNNNN